MRAAPFAVKSLAVLSAEPVARLTASSLWLLPACGCHATPVQRSSCARTDQRFWHEGDAYTDSAPPQPAAF